MLKIVNVHKRFKGLSALEGINVEVKEGDIYGLIGPNGAGKTTLINVITSYLKPTSGSIFFRGRDITNKKVHQIARRGIARTFQNICLFDAMTVFKGKFKLSTKICHRVVPTSTNTG